MPAVNEAELGGAGLAHGHPGVGDPDRGRVPQLVAGVVRAQVVVQAHECRLPAPVVLDGTVQSVQPVISLLDIPGNDNNVNITFIMYILQFTLL